MREHYLYLPSIGVALALLPVVQRLFVGTGNGRRVGRVLLAVVPLVLAARTADRSADFRSERHYYEAAHARAPKNARVGHYLGVIYTEAGECSRALPLLANSSEGVSARLRRDSLAAQILCSEQQGQRENSAGLVERLLALSPEDAYGLALRGRSHLESGEPEQAVADLSRALQRTEGREPGIVPLLSAAYNQLGRHTEAYQLLRDYPASDLWHCEQEVLALLGLGVDRYGEAFGRVNACLVEHPNALRLIELRVGLFFASGRLEDAEADIERMQSLGASDEQLRRAHGFRPNPE